MVLVPLARWQHLFSFRTQKLSASAPMILAWQRAGTVGRRQNYSFQIYKKVPLFLMEFFIML